VNEIAEFLNERRNFSYRKFFITRLLAAELGDIGHRTRIFFAHMQATDRLYSVTRPARLVSSPFKSRGSSFVSVIVIERRNGHSYPAFLTKRRFSLAKSGLSQT